MELKDENNEYKDEKIICKCGSDKFKVYITTIIDDARLYCVKCKKEW